MKLSEMTIGVVGNGVVGQATARSYLEHVKEVRCWDKEKLRKTHPIHTTLQSDLIFLCLPTPAREDGSCDISKIEGFFQDLKDMAAPTGKYSSDKNYVLKSTVPVGTTKRLAEKYGLTNLVHSPEFLTARCATLDAQIPSRNIIGVTTEEYGYRDIWVVVRDLYLARFPHIPILTMRSDESEAVKLFQNSFFATKIAFWNEMREFSDAKGLDWGTVLNATLADGRIHPSHTQVPGPDGKRGFGGACLPKDLSSLIDQYFGTSGVSSPDVLLAANLRNKRDRREG